MGASYGWCKVCHESDRPEHKHAHDSSSAQRYSENSE